ncbi:LytR/AlgR family response regulator transcription factor [Peptacetobacter sp.]|uniref:LytR/AlgR family response regulator transcription factor n=1 Tax=Peptacetobacter sp. TaxID=2991975 RepID=UPI002942378E|nr:LytTR family DNA-binding domain-containing protein [Peptacetobacter sp.]MEE0452175.1 LytTR family DNA-binding domain-containing protein [Peptacetobacter sp.]
MINIVICEDEVIQLNNLFKNIQKILYELNLNFKIYTFNSAKELLENYPKNVSIIYLDIKMKEINGVDAARKIREFDKKVEIIFITAIDDYLKEGYEVRAYRYLIKPVSYSELLKHTKICIEEIEKNSEVIIIRDSGNISIINKNDILYIEVLRKYTTVYTLDNSYTFKIPLKILEESLKEKIFFKCHKSYIINIKKIINIDEKEGVCILEDDSKVPISKRKHKEFNDRLADVLGDII